ncbi:MAG: hypothetical protein ACREJ0_14740 [Geminicoccaceae bacterium]
MAERIARLVGVPPHRFLMMFRTSWPVISTCTAAGMAALGLCTAKKKSCALDDEV